MDVAEKKKLVADLNHQATQDREKTLKTASTRQAAELLRHRVVVKGAAKEATAWTEGRHRGLVARTIVIYLR